MPLERKHATILLVEDHLTIRAVVRDALQHVGYTVVTATNGVEGLHLYQQRRPEISMLITDVMMPGMNGLDLADRVLECDPQLPVLFMSASTESPSRGLGCLEKPFTFAELIGRVSQGLRGRKPLETQAALPEAEYGPC